jgi:hypothetical protein
MLKEYEDQQAALIASRQAEETRRLEQHMAQQREFEEAQRQQAERERLAQEELLRQQQQAAQFQMSNQAAVRLQEMEREMLAMRGQWERDQLMLEQYDRVSDWSVCLRVRQLNIHSRGSRHLKGPLMPPTPMHWLKWAERTS